MSASVFLGLFSIGTNSHFSGTAWSELCGSKALRLVHRSCCSWCGASSWLLQRRIRQGNLPLLHEGPAFGKWVEAFEFTVWYVLSPKWFHSISNFLTTLVNSCEYHVLAQGLLYCHEGWLESSSIPSQLSEKLPVQFDTSGCEISVQFLMGKTLGTSTIALKRNPSWFSKQLRMCDRCFASQAQSVPDPMNYKNFGSRKAWDLTTIRHESYLHLDHGKLSPWLCVSGFKVETMAWDLLHNVFLGTARDFVASSMKCMIMRGCYDSELTADQVLDYFDKKVRAMCSKHKFPGSIYFFFQNKPSVAGFQTFWLQHSKTHYPTMQGWIFQQSPWSTATIWKEMMTTLNFHPGLRVQLSKSLSGL